MNFKSKILDLNTNEVYPAEIAIENGFFKEITPIAKSQGLENLKLDFEGIIVPGFIDAHIHIESTMLTPSNFAEAVLPLGTTSVIADPHEIANVLGIKGIDFMIKDGKTVPFDFYYSAPSCVPSTSFETSGSSITPSDIEELMKKEEIVALGEVMNYVGVINEDPEIMEKIKIAKNHKKPIDGHAPQLLGEDLKKYVDILSFGTDHECTSFNEAIEKKNLGMKIMVREGSSAKDMESLFNIKDRIELFSNQDFFGTISSDDFGAILKNPIFDFLVSDDKDPDDLIKGHLDLLIKKAVDFGIDPIEAIKMITKNPAEHYNLNSGEIANGKIANFVVIDNLNDFNIKETYVHGKLVAKDGKTLFKSEKSETPNNFILNKKIPEDFDIKIKDNIENELNRENEINRDNELNKENEINKVNIKVIEALNKEILTNELKYELKVKNGIICPDLDKDILNLAVVERYGNNKIANAFIKGFNLKNGAIASSIAHDSHNIIVVGTNSEYMAKAVNLINENKGGLAIVSNNQEKLIALPVAGLMSNEKIEKIAIDLKELDNFVKSLGCKLDSPFMTLSFMALLVIPKLRLSDNGLFDVENFEFVDLVDY